MRFVAKPALTLLAFACAAATLAGCAPATVPQTAPASKTPTAIASPPARYLTVLPEWAKESTPWLIYPDGFECGGSEGCPNDFRSFFGEPGPVLPDGVEYYNSARHDCVVVAPAGVNCLE